MVSILHTNETLRVGTAYAEAEAATHAQWRAAIETAVTGTSVFFYGSHISPRPGTPPDAPQEGACGAPPHRLSICSGELRNTPTPSVPGS